MAGYPLGVLINKVQDRRAGCAGASSLGKWGEVGAGLGWAWCACGGLPNKGREKTVSSGTQAGQGVGRQGWAPPHMEPRCVLLVQLAQAPVRPQAPLSQLGVCLSGYPQFPSLGNGQRHLAGTTPPSSFPSLVGCGGPERLGGLPGFLRPLFPSICLGLLPSCPPTVTPAPGTSLVRPKHLLRPAPHPALHHGPNQEAGF